MRSTWKRNAPARPAATNARLAIENLEDRLTPSWGSVPPSLVAVPTNAVAVALNTAGDATGGAAITANETDWYTFTARAGSSTFTATGNLDTVIGVYNASGQRVAFNDDISSTNLNSRTTVTLAAGTYYLGLTNYVGTRGGSYTWAVDSPAAPVSPPPSPPPATGGFQITLRTTGLTASQQAVFQQAANRWAQVITGDLPNATYNGIAVDDVLIDASGAAIDGVGGILGQAGPDFVRSGTLIPIHGTMQFDTADLASLEASGGLYFTVLHEMGHVLGLGTIWQQRGLVSGAGTANPVYTGANAVAAYNSIFGTSATGVPLENTGGAGTRDSHWRESVFGNEVMTGYLNSGNNPLSRVTIGSLADLGYQVNYSAADAYTPPGGSLVSGGGGGGTSGGPPRLLAPSAPGVLAPGQRQGLRDAWFDYLG
ncbi:MAG: hypothetical protein K2V38_19435, partial [Gemmataceae bacterium]|nr:hypothetical protein [Gemmataceae bacterium]